ncbi:MAG TPA: M48 family metallopeptidase [Xanthomonadaceae bacterium]|jgi:predicted Zn-dependent protease
MNMDPMGQWQGGSQGRGRFHWWVIVVFLVYAGYYWVSNEHESSFTGREQIIATDAQQEATLGLQAYQQVLAQSQVAPDGPQVEQIRQIVQRLVAVAPKVEADLAAAHGAKASTDWSSFQWEVNVLQSDEVNAFCLPGGKIAVYTGLLPVAQNADALAVVLGHEISHALLRHGAERMAQQHLAQLGTIATGIAAGSMDPQQQREVMAALGVGAQFGVLLPFSRKDESEADEIGLMLAAAACFDPQAAIPLWERMEQQGGAGKPPEFASDHPSDAHRIQRLQELMPQALALRAKYCGSASPQ